MQGYDPNLSSRYIGLSKKPHTALSILVIPIHEKMASGPWNINDKLAYDYVNIASVCEAESPRVTMTV